MKKPCFQIINTYPAIYRYSNNMGRNYKVKHIIPILVILLLLSSGFVGVSNTAEEQWVDAETIERDEFLDNLAFYYLDASGGNAKYEYYKEKLLKEYSNDDIGIVEEITIPVEPPQTSVSPWSMKCHDKRHTSRSPYSTANVTGLEKWRFKTGSWIEDGGAIGEDGTIYIGSWDGYLYAVNPNGTLKWKYDVGLFVWSSPAIAEDGTLYVTSSGYHRLDAVYPNGTRKWRFNAEDSIWSSPAIAEDGTIYFGILGPGWDKGRLYAVNQNGTEKWHYDTEYYIISSPAIGEDGTIYVGSCDKHLYAFYPNGTLRWRYKTGDLVKGPPSIAEDGTIYVGSMDDYLYALYPNGTRKWRCKIDWGSETNPSIGSDGTIYIGGKKLYAVNPNGTLKWSFNLGEERHIHKSSPAISGDGTIYVGTHIGEGVSGEIIAVNPDGTEKWREIIANNWVQSSPIIGSNGTVYIGSSWDIEINPGQFVSAGYLHAFGELDSNAPEAPDIDGPPTGNPGTEYEYAFVTTDPNWDNVYYNIEWGDGKVEDWIGPYGSGEEIFLNHTWNEEGTYTIRARAKDTNNLWGPWGELEVTMPKNQQSQNWWFLQFLQNHPRMFPMLRQLLGFY